MGFLDKIKDTLIDTAQGKLNDVKGSMSTSKSSKNDAKESGQSSGATPQSDAGPLYSPALEKLIAMAIEDGEISDDDLSILARRAEKEGIDPDEFILVVKMRLKKKRREQDKIANRNPVEALSQTFKMLEQYAKGGESVVRGSDLSAALALIPGVGPLAATGGLLASFIKTPSNINELKAEAIRLFTLPDDPALLMQFIHYADSQIQQSYQKKADDNGSIKKIISSLTIGSEIDIVPIWEMKIMTACDKALANYPDNAELCQTAIKCRPTLLNKIKAGRINILELSMQPVPDDDDELLGIVAHLYSLKSTEWALVKDIYSKYYKTAKKRFANDPQRLEKLKQYKTFSLF